MQVSQPDYRKMNAYLKKSHIQEKCEYIFVSILNIASYYRHKSATHMEKHPVEEKSVVHMQSIN